MSARYFLPRHMYGHPGCPQGKETQPYLASIFRCAGPPAPPQERDLPHGLVDLGRGQDGLQCQVRPLPRKFPRPQDVLLFNNSRTARKEVACNLTVRRVANVMNALEGVECRAAEVGGGEAPPGEPGPALHQLRLWLLQPVGDRRHRGQLPGLPAGGAGAQGAGDSPPPVPGGWGESLVPQPRVASAAAAVLAGVARRRAKMPGDTLYVGVHVR